MQRASLVMLCWAAVVVPAAAAPSCNQTAGAAQAHRYVEQCLAVSPATHPPCNADNPCDLIRDEIRRGCGMLQNDAPAFCHAGKAD